jgi:NAD(P)-dependent dehydrogenase (short-subunit alcohol dehydrogenase family)
MAVIENKVAIVTGAGRGIGRAISLEFAQEGAKVAVVSRTAATVEEAVVEIREIGGEAIGVTADVGDRESIAIMVGRTVEAFGTVDILVNNARTYGTRANPGLGRGQSHALEVFPEDEWDWMFETGLKATLRSMQAVFPYMKDRGGRIINFGSRSGVLATAGAAAYNANKEAIRALSRTAAREWGPYGINVNVINPVIETDTYRAAVSRTPGELERQMQKVPLRRVGSPIEAARVAVFLAGPDSAYVTGMTFAVDGGRTILP